MLRFIAESLSSPEGTNSLSNYYIHVSMAKAGAVAVVLFVIFKKSGKKKKFCRAAKSRTSQGWFARADEMRWQLSSGYVGTATQQRGVDDFSLSG